MNGHRWGAQGPPLEAYSRVTNPERFACLHKAAADLLDRLEEEFNVVRAEGQALGVELEAECKLVRPNVALVPHDAAAAPIVVAFSAFPGLRVRFGRWWTAAFPNCGCDACDETAESEIERLNSLVDHLTAGHFREAIWIPADGPALQKFELWSVRERWSQQSQIDRVRARQFVAAGDRISYDWKAWPRRM